jgi:hypothetical protein
LADGLSRPSVRRDLGPLIRMSRIRGDGAIRRRGLEPTALSGPGGARGFP